MADADASSDQPASSDDQPAAATSSQPDAAPDVTSKSDGAPANPLEELRRHLTEEAAIVAGVLEDALDRAIGIDESRIDWANPAVPRSSQLEDGLTIRFQQEETSCACLLPSWMLPDGKGTVTTIADDLPARLVAAIMPESLPFHQPRRAETAEVVADEVWAAADRPRALRLPCDGREDPIWIFVGLDAERIRIGHDRLHNVPVRVVVTLAEKRIEVGQLSGISPGTLITFSKPCEELLDLYVNNRAFCRGEAVKIGEKFGLKVTEIGVKPVRESRVLNAR